MNDNVHSHRGSEMSYLPGAVYFEDSDSVEYVRRDVPCVYRRIDELLTLILDFDSREPLGFQLKGFKHYYLKAVGTAPENNDFIHVIELLQFAVTKIGNNVFGREDLISGYERALHIADEDKVRMPDISMYAAAN